MTPDKQFIKFFSEIDPLLLGPGSYSISRMAWLEATRQAYEDAANIVIDSPSYFTSKDRVGLAQVIRQRLKEYDNGN